MSDKKRQQLGMNPSTAQGRLVKDLLWKSVIDTGQNQCFHCGLPMTRETFSIEHKTPWLDSENPKETFFDLENISYSHLSCNIAVVRRVQHDLQCGTFGKYRKGCRCDDCRLSATEKNAKHYSTEKRQDRYQRNGK